MVLEGAEIQAFLAEMNAVEARADVGIALRDSRMLLSTQSWNSNR